MHGRRLKLSSGDRFIVDIFIPPHFFSTFRGGAFKFTIDCENLAKKSKKNAKWMKSIKMIVCNLRGFCLLKHFSHSKAMNNVNYWKKNLSCRLFGELLWRQRLAILIFLTLHLSAGRKNCWIIKKFLFVFLKTIEKLKL